MNRTLTKFFCALIALFLFQACSSQKSEFILNSNQSMSLSGKGPGQDAAINPYMNEDHIAIVKNLGKVKFSARVQYRGKIIQTTAIPPNETREIELKKGYELYLDSELPSKADVTFKRK